MTKLTNPSANCREMINWEQLEMQVCCLQCIRSMAASSAFRRHFNLMQKDISRNEAEVNGEIQTLSDDPAIMEIDTSNSSIKLV